MSVSIERLIEKRILVWTSCNILEPKDNNLLLVGGHRVEAVCDLLVGWDIKTNAHDLHPFKKNQQVELEVYVKVTI